MFEWIRQLDKQRTYSYDLSLESTPPTPRKMKYVGMEWIRGIDQQLTYFNPSMFISLESISFSTTNPWEDGSTINFKGKVIYAQNKSVKYSIAVNGNTVVVSDILAPTPLDLDIYITISDLDLGENELVLLIVDEDDVVINYNFAIIKENRDTFIFKRIFDFKEDYITDENIEVIYGRGLTLKEIGTGEVNIEIPTEGKSKVKSIIIEGGDDKEEELIIEREMTYLNDLGEGKVYESRLLTEYTDIVDIEVI